VDRPDLIPAVFESPAHPAVVSWARAFAASASIAAGADEECADNVRLAVSEIVTLAMAVDSSAPIRIELVATEEAIVMEVEPWSTELPDDPVVDPWMVITSIADEVTVSGAKVTVKCNFVDSPC